MLPVVSKKTAAFDIQILKSVSREVFGSLKVKEFRKAQDSGTLSPDPGEALV